MSHTFRLTCPCECGEILVGTDEGFAATDVRLPLCAVRKATGPAYIVASYMAKAAAYARAI